MLMDVRIDFLLGDARFYVPSILHSNPSNQESKEYIFFFLGMQRLDIDLLIIGTYTRKTNIPIPEYPE